MLGLEGFLEAICILAREQGTSSMNLEGIVFLTRQRKMSLSLVPSLKLGVVLPVEIMTIL